MSNIKYVKINEEDLKLAEEFFENEKHFSEFIYAVICNYREKNYQIKNKIVQKYFNSYQKTMRRVKKGIETGGLWKEKNETQSIDNHDVYKDNPSRVPSRVPIDNPQTQYNKVNKDNKVIKEKEIIKEINFDFKKSLIDFGFDSKLVEDWMKIRKTKKAINTETSFKGFIREIEKRKEDKNEILKIMVERDWKGFKSEWLDNFSNTENKANTNTIYQHTKVNY